MQLWIERIYRQRLSSISMFARSRKVTLIAKRPANSIWYVISSTSPATILPEIVAKTKTHKATNLDTKNLQKRGDKSIEKANQQIFSMHWQSSHRAVLTSHHPSQRWGYRPLATAIRRRERLLRRVGPWEVWIPRKRYPGVCLPNQQRLPLNSFWPLRSTFHFTAIRNRTRQRMTYRLRPENLQWSHGQVWTTTTTRRERSTCVVFCPTFDSMAP